MSKLEDITTEDILSFFEEREKQAKEEQDKIIKPLEAYIEKIDNDLDACQGCCEDVDEMFEIRRKCKELIGLIRGDKTDKKEMVWYDFDEAMEAIGQGAEVYDEQGEKIIGLVNEKEMVWNLEGLRGLYVKRNKFF